MFLLMSIKTKAQDARCSTHKITIKYKTLKMEIYSEDKADGDKLFEL